MSIKSMFHASCFIKVYYLQCSMHHASKYEKDLELLALQATIKSENMINGDYGLPIHLASFTLED